MATPSLITLSDPRSEAAEAYRTLRTNLLLATNDKPLATVLVTCASAGEADDKSNVAANLAVTLAQIGHKTILVDADLRRPMQHTLWTVGDERGLSNMFAEDALLANPPLVSTNIPTLQVLPAGRADVISTDVISSQRMNEIISVLKTRAHYVVFDVPPILIATDAVLMGLKLDGALLAVRAETARRDDVARAKQALERANVRLLGAVLTNAQHDTPRKAYGK
jgi:capsular exopolysaccharide synthesis family protein